VNLLQEKAIKRRKCKRKSGKLGKYLILTSAAKAVWRVICLNVYNSPKKEPQGELAPPCIGRSGATVGR